MAYSGQTRRNGEAYWKPQFIRGCRAWEGEARGGKGRKGWKEGKREEEEVNEHMGRHHVHELNVYHNKMWSCYSDIYKSIIYFPSPPQRTPSKNTTVSSLNFSANIWSIPYISWSDLPFLFLSGAGQSKIRKLQHVYWALSSLLHFHTILHYPSQIST